MIHRHTSFIVTGAILVAVVVAVAPYSTNVANAQSTNMTKNMTGSNMSKTMNMTAGGGGNMSKTMNMTAGGGGNMSKK